MKKVRIMLVAIAVLGTVGGALAFKAKKFGSDRYCTTTTGGGNFCPVPLENASFDNGAGALLKYTPRPAGSCVNIPCLTTGHVNI